MSRVQLALNVNDIDEAVTFYSKLFGAEPAKRRPGYANFAIAEPPLKLVLLENPGQGGSLNHLGVEVADTGAVDAEQARLAAAGLAWSTSATRPAATPSRTSSGSQGAPDGESWEFYTVLEDSATFYGEEDSQACCGGPAGSSAGSAVRPAASGDRAPRRLPRGVALQRSTFARPGIGTGCRRRRDDRTTPLQPFRSSLRSPASGRHRVVEIN